jgi:hypothetical protein
MGKSASRLHLESDIAFNHSTSSSLGRYTTFQCKGWTSKEIKQQPSRRIRKRTTMGNAATELRTSAETDPYYKQTAPSLKPPSSGTDLL